MNVPKRGLPHSRRVVLLGVALICTMVLAACGSSSSSSVATTTTAAPTSTTVPAKNSKVCDAARELKTSLAALAAPSLITSGKAGIRSAVNTVQDNLNDLKTAAGRAYRSQVNALQDSLANLKKAVGNLGNGNVSENIKAVTTAAGSVVSQANSLFDTLQSPCGT